MVHKINKAVKELDKGYLFWGNITDVLEKNNIYKKNEIKQVLDELGIENKKLRHFVYDQMELKKGKDEKVWKEYNKMGMGQKIEDW